MSDPSNYTIAWICAVNVEYTVAQMFLDEKHESPQYVSPHDNNLYTLGRMKENNIVIAVPPEGTVLQLTAAVINALLNSFPNIRVSLLVGIGSGAPSLKHDIRLGDVVVGISGNEEGGIFQYDVEKTIQSQEFHEIGSNQAPALLRTAVTTVQGAIRTPGHIIKHRVHEAVDNVPRKWPKQHVQRYMRPEAASDILYRASVIHSSGSDCSTVCGNDSSSLIKRDNRGEYDNSPEIHYGLIASAYIKIKDASFRDKLIEKRDVLCFDTEAAGLMDNLPCLVIRGIKNYSDSHGDDKWEGYAAMTAAAYARELLYQLSSAEVEAQQRSRIILNNLKAQDRGSNSKAPNNDIQMDNARPGETSEIFEGTTAKPSQLMELPGQSLGYRSTQASAPIVQSSSRFNSTIRLGENASLGLGDRLADYSSKDFSQSGLVFWSDTSTSESVATTNDSLQSGLHDLSEPLQEVFAPYLENEVRRRQVEDRIEHLQSNVKLRQEAAMDFLHSLGSVTQLDAGTTYSDTLMAGVRELPEPLQKYVMTYLENKTAQGEVEKWFAELERNTKLRQNSALELLDALGSAEGTENRNQYSSKDAKEQENLPEDEVLPTSKGDTPSDPGEEASQQSIPKTTTARRSQSRNIYPSFFDWTGFWSHQLDETKDIMENKYIAVLALYKTAKLDFSAQGISFGIEGLLGLIRDLFHTDDVLAYFRSVKREILLPVDYSEEENHQQLLKSLDINLFDLSKFSGLDTRLTSVTYGSSRYGTVTLFKLTDAIEGVPTTIRPLAAMRQVPKIIIKKMGQGINGSIKTTLTMPSHRIWDATKQKEVGRMNPPLLKPSLSSYGSNISHSIGGDLRFALSMDSKDALLSEFSATIPQMVAMLHHKTSIIQHIKSTSVHVEEMGRQPWVQMEAGPDRSGHENNDPQIIVLAPARGEWVDMRYFWK
ncbi:hypothetical protein MKX08_001994 [Trichoderma sp. CBMAI-0020]|nr:hypothetical protein MKX08_001994 [Trichoderma sp. CBMAI-0020]